MEKILKIFRLKKIDYLIISSFIPPFLVTFAIGLFTLLMQFLWVYIDDIAGKGVGFWVLLELIAYRLVGLVPWALPLAILISSVMVMGNMAEKYELSSIKSGGVSLFRTILSIILFGIASAGVSWMSNNYFIPAANLKFFSRMYDVQQQKPALHLDAGVFNDDFFGYAMHIGHKGADGKEIKDVMIYDHSDAGRGYLRSIIAKEGSVQTTDDERFFILDLRNGFQYEEQPPSVGPNKHKQAYPFIRLEFERMTKVFDMSEFDMSRSSDDRFSNNKNALSFKELSMAIDSIDAKMNAKMNALSGYMGAYFYFIKKEQKVKADQAYDKKIKELDEASKNDGAQSDSISSDNKEKSIKGLANLSALNKKKKNSSNLNKKNRSGGKKYPLPKQDTTHLANDTTFLQLYTKKDIRRYFSKVNNSIRSVNNQARVTKSSVGSLKESKINHLYDLHMKYSFAVVCILFVFVGGPMGAIVRKGGFGYPLIIAVSVFILFIVMTILFKKVAESHVLPVVLAAWMPNLIIIPIAIFLSIRAANDRGLT